MAKNLHPNFLQGIHITKTKEMLQFSQTLTLVLDESSRKSILIAMCMNQDFKAFCDIQFKIVEIKHNTWTLQSLFKRQNVTKCAFCTSSNFYLSKSLTMNSTANENENELQIFPFSNDLSITPFSINQTAMPNDKEQTISMQRCHFLNLIIFVFASLVFKQLHQN